MGSTRAGGAARAEGKGEPVPAWRLLAVHARRRAAATRARRARARAGALRAAWDRAARSARCELVTVVGDAGSRQVAAGRRVRSATEAPSSAAAASPTATGSPTGRWSRCWSSSTRLRPIGSRRAASGAARRDGRGTSAERSPGRSASCSRGQRGSRWSCVFDDIQWGEEAFLDLIEHVGASLDGAPILLVCMARPELLDRRARLAARAARAARPRR